jgi:conjugal transfer mating pair stabilization protein TraN
MVLMAAAVDWQAARLRCARALASLALAACWSGALAQPASAPASTPGQAAAAGRALGVATNPGTQAGITTATGQAIVPSYGAGASAPQQSYYGNGNGNVAGPTTAKLAACANGTSAECTAVNLMQQRSSTANPVTVNPQDPLVVNARSVTQQPSTTLGVSSAIFVNPQPTSTCVPATVTTGGPSTIETCESYHTIGETSCTKSVDLRIEPWWNYQCEKSNVVVTQSTCTKTLDVTVDLVPNCPVGDVIATTLLPFGYMHESGPDLYTHGGVVKAFCDPATVDQVRISLGIKDVREGQFGAGANYAPPPDVNLLIPLVSASLPTNVTQLIPLGPAPDYRAYALPGSRCDPATGQCTYNFFSGEARFVCPAGEYLAYDEQVGSPDSGFTTATRLVSQWEGHFPGDVNGRCVQRTGPAAHTPPATPEEAEIWSCAANETLRMGSTPDCWGASGSAFEVIGTGAAHKTFSISFQMPRLTPQITNEALISTCGGEEASSMCTAVGSRCNDGPSTRTLNGLDVTRQCWRTEYDYECLTPGGPNSCAPLTAEPLCAQTSVDTCRAYSANGTCISFDAKYRCTKDMGPPPSVVEIGHGYTTTRDLIDDAACTALRTNTTCSMKESVCLDSADKTFYGFTFSKPCWTYQDTYVCPNAPTSNCQPFVEQGCTVLPAQTTCISQFPNGQCDQTRYYYQCGTPVVTTTTETVCDAQPYCINGVCYDRARPSDPDFGKAVTMKEVARQAGTYLDLATFTVFEGEANQCRNRMFVNCCKGSNANTGGGLTNRAFYTATDFGRTYLGSPYVVDILSSWGVPEVITSALASLGGGSASVAACTAASNTYTAYGVTIGWGQSGFEFVSFDPYTFIAMVMIYIAMEMLTSCQQDEMVFAVKKGQGLCEHMGTYCHTRFGGSCLETKESYCCFNSKLAKAVSTQGKQQLGISMGTPQNPNCQGLTIDQLNQLDFSRIDLSEFVASITSNAIGDSEAVAAAVTRLTTPNAPYGTVPLPSGGASPGPAAPPAPTPPPSTGPPEPVITVAFNPVMVTVGDSYTLTTNVQNATSASFTCQGPLAGIGTVPAGTRVDTRVAAPAHVGTTSCRFTAESAGMTSAVEVTLTVYASPPALTARFTPETIPGGAAFTLTTAATDATSLDYRCTGATTSSGSLPVGNATTPMVANPAAVGTTECTFTARSIHGTTNTSASYTVAPVFPTLAAAYGIPSVRVGQEIVLSTTTTDAAGLTYDCTGAMAGTGSLPTGAQVRRTVAGVSSIGLTTCQLTARSVTGHLAQQTVQVTVTP